ncbi:MAG: proline--tRNA ligase [Planctomycetes bacterium]|nr:proline--tRNA ligase [Planctomycetota bacterium]
MAEQSPITPRAKDFPEWYQDVIRAGDLAEPAIVVKGAMVIKPNGYAIWEKIQRELDDRIKATGHRNAYFPMFIPESFLKKEAEHVEGFSPELAVVTIGGGKELEERYVVRPTSETIIGHFFAKWIQSHRDLPMLINQWANIVRWELRTRMFLRTSEFLWQEGHTAHATHEESLKEVLRMLDVYADFAENVMAMPVIRGEKTASEKFAGGVKSYCIEGLMQNGWALQAGTSHDLGQNFGKAFDVKFQNMAGQSEYVWQTSWGVSTRLIGGLVMTHSDDAGLVCPPKLAPYHVVVIPIFKNDAERAATEEVGRRMVEDLKGKGLSVVFDNRDERPGAKYFEWERKGACARIEIGPKDLEKKSFAFKRRDLEKKEFVPMEKGVDHVVAQMEAMQKDLFNKAKKFRDESTRRIDTWDAFKAQMDGAGGFASCHWCGDGACEGQVKEDTKVTIRCIPLGNAKEAGKCVRCGRESGERVLFARAY